MSSRSPSMEMDQQGEMDHQGEIASSDSSSNSSEEDTSSLSARKRSQLEQMFEKEIDDESCAHILKMDVALVRAFHEELQNGESEKHGISRKESGQLTQLFNRQISEGTCAKILHVPISAVKDFKEKEDSDAIKRKASQGDVKAIAMYVKKLSVRAAVAVQGKAAALNNPTFQVSAGTAVAGSVAGGIVGGGTGTVIGGTFGTIAGVVPAVFTLGASIPIGMLLGSGVGLCAGVAVGSSVGAVAGGASGYGGYVYRKEIGNTGAACLNKVRSVAERARSRVLDSAKRVSTAIEARRAG